MITLFVTGIEFYGYHGVSDEEQRVGHRYIVDLEMDVNSSSERTDAVEDTVDYGEAALLVVEIGTRDRCRTVERLAQQICDTLLERFPRISEVSVRISKRLPPCPVIAEEAGAELVVMRSPR